MFWDGLKKGVFKEEGLQPEAYREKKYFNLNIDKLIDFILAFISSNSDEAFSFERIVLPLASSINSR